MSGGRRDSQTLRARTGRRPRLTRGPRPLGRHRGVGVLAARARAAAAAAAGRGPQRERGVPLAVGGVDGRRRPHRRPLLRRRELTTIVAYHRAGGPTEADQQQIDAEARSLCDSRAIPDLKAVTTPYASACGDLGGQPRARDAALAGVAGRLDRARHRRPPGARTRVTWCATSRRCDKLFPASGSPRAGRPRDRRSGLHRRRQRGVRGHRPDAAGDHAALVLVLLLVTYRSPVVALVPLFAVGDRLPGRGRRGLRAGSGGRAAGHRPDDRDPDRADVRRGHRLLPAAGRRARARRAATSPRGPSRATGAGRRSCRPARPCSPRCSCSASPTTGRRATMGPVLALGIAVMVAAGLTLVPALLSVLPRVRAAPGRHVWERFGAAPRPHTPRRDRRPPCSCCSSPARSATCRAVVRSTSRRRSATRRSRSAASS